MVEENRHVVTLMDVFAHANTLRRKRRGIRPKEIKYPHHCLQKSPLIPSMKAFCMFFFDRKPLFSEPYLELSSALFGRGQL